MKPIGFYTFGSVYCVYYNTIKRANTQINYTKVCNWKPQWGFEVKEMSETYRYLAKRKALGQYFSWGFKVVYSILSYKNKYAGILLMSLFKSWHARLNIKEKAIFRAEMSSLNNTYSMRNNEIDIQICLYWSICHWVEQETKLVILDQFYKTDIVLYLCNIFGWNITNIAIIKLNKLCCHF